MTAPRALIRATGFRECFNQGPPGMVTDRSLPVGQGTEVLGIALPPHVRFTKPTGTPAMSMTFPDIFGVCMSRNIISIPYYRPISFEFVAISLCFWGKTTADLCHTLVLREPLPPEVEKVPPPAIGETIGSGGYLGRLSSQ